MHYRLCQLSGELGGWKLTGNHSQNGALWLTDGSYRARILHTLSLIRNSGHRVRDLQ